MSQCLRVRGRVRGRRVWVAVTRLGPGQGRVTSGWTANVQLRLVCVDPICASRYNQGSVSDSGMG